MEECHGVSLAMGPCPALCPLCLAPMSTFGTRSSHSGSLVIQSQPSAGAKRCKLCQLAPQNKNYESNKIYPKSIRGAMLPCQSLRLGLTYPSIWTLSTFHFSILQPSPSNRVEKPQSICYEAQCVHDQHWNEKEKAFRRSLDKTYAKFEGELTQERTESMPGR